MGPVPEVGQIVRVLSFEGKLIVKSVSEDAGTVQLVSMTEHPSILDNVPINDLLPGEDLSAG